MEQFVRQYIQTHEAVFNYYGEMTHRTMSLAATFTMANKPFSGMALQKVEDELTQYVSKHLSFPKMAVDESLTAIWQLSNGQPLPLEEYGERVKQLVDVGFPTKKGTLIAAFYLVGGEAHAKRAFELHTEMKNYHPFLTDSGDIPITVFITQNDAINIEEIAQLMRKYYDELKEYFWPGDALQLLSQFLVLWSPQYNEHLIPYVNQLKIEFKKRNVRITRNVYYVLGILTLNSSDTEVVEEVMKLYKLLIQTKLLKHNKDVALQIAVRKVVQQRAEQLDLAVKGVGTRMNELLNTLQFIGQLPIAFSHLIPDIPFLD